MTGSSDGSGLSSGAMAGSEERAPAANEDTNRMTDAGVPVGAADLEADALRSQAGDDEERSGREEGLDVDPDRATDRGVPVGRADAEADRRRSAGDDRG